MMHDNVHCITFGGLRVIGGGGMQRMRGVMAGVPQMVVVNGPIFFYLGVLSNVMQGVYIMVYI